MKIDKMINIEITEEEMKQAVLEWLEKRLTEDYLEHIKENHWTIDFSKEGWVICVDGILK